MMSASERAVELNELYGCNLATDDAHWAEYGITTSEQLDEYLDDCASEAQKDFMDESFASQYDEDEVDESVDGDHESGLASAGFGTDEDYGYYGDE